MKRILIIGEDSYIGTSFKKFCEQYYPGKYEIDTLDTRKEGWKRKSFLGYESIVDCVGIAHIKETKMNSHLYYEVNRDLTVELAKKAKEEGVRQFVLLSTMAVYGLTVGHITKNQKENPCSAYGISKVQADREISKLADDKFKFACVRPPMVYGENCKGNYRRLRKLAVKTPLIPQYGNQRSMIYIGNLCEFIKEIIEKESGGVFFPQNAEYVNTSEMIKLIAQVNNRDVKETRVFNWVIDLLQIDLFRKIFGSLTYEKVDCISKFSFIESILLSEGKSCENNCNIV